MEEKDIDRGELKDDLLLETTLSFCSLFGAREYVKNSSLARIFSALFVVHLLDALLTYLGIAVSNPYLYTDDRLFERNPIMALVIDHFGIVKGLGIKVLFVLVALSLLLVATKRLLKIRILKIKALATTLLITSAIVIIIPWVQRIITELGFELFASFMHYTKEQNDIADMLLNTLYFLSTFRLTALIFFIPALYGSLLGLGLIKKHASLYQNKPGLLLASQACIVIMFLWF